MRLGFLIVFFLVAAPAAAQPPHADQAPQTATAIVPVVSNIIGFGGIRWKADVAIVNDTGGAVDVALELPAAPDSPALFLTLEPGQVQRFTDFFGQAFGLEGVLSPLRVTTGGRRSVTVTTNVYALLPSGSSPVQSVPTYYSSSFFPTRTLDGLAFSGDRRTNIGLVNLSDSEADFLLALQRIPGRNLAVMHVRVAAGAMVQQAIQLLFPMITEGTGFTVVVETSSPDTVVYASVIDNYSHEARFVTARIGL